MATKIHFDDADDPIDICMDNVFKAVFTRDTPASQMALSSLVSALIGREVTIIAIVANEPPIGNLRDRQIRNELAGILGSIFPVSDRQGQTGEDK